MVKFRCSGCGRKLGVPSSYAGRKVKCKDCGSVVEVPSDEPVVALETEPSSPLGEALLSVNPAAAERPQPVALAAAAKEPRGERACPKCGRSCGAAAAICTGCGHSFKMGVNVKHVEAAKKAASVGGGTIAAIVGGAIAATVCAAIWAGVTMGTGYEIGYMAWGLGFVVGAVVAAAARAQNVAVGGVAALAAGSGLVMAKVFIVVWALPSVLASELGSDTELLQMVMTGQMIERGEFTPDTVDMAAVHQRVTSMSPDEKQAFCRQTADAILGEMTMQEKVTTLLSPHDALWTLLALGTAFAVGKGKGEA